MAYDGFYSGLSSRQAVSEILTQAQRVRDQIIAEVAAFDPKYDAALAAVAEANVVLGQVTILATQASQDSALAITSAAQARASELAAMASEVASLVAETASKASEVAAKTSETNSKASELAAKASELAAKASQTAALASEVAAKASQDAAKVSETNSKASETNSKDSEVASKASEVAAKTSETASASSATASAGSASAALVSKDAAKVSQDAAKASEVAAKVAEESALLAGVPLGMVAWGNRNRPFDGFVLDDGQELPHSLYPSFVQALRDGLFPVATEETWQSASGIHRGKFVIESSPGHFRMRDLNGVSAGSVTKGSFLRGSPASNTQGIHVLDRVGPLLYTSTGVAAALSPIFSSDNPTGSATVAVLPRAQNINTAQPVSAAGNGSKWITNTHTETVPQHTLGAWMTKLFGTITPLGVAEAANLATAYAELSSRVNSFEERVEVLERTFGYSGAWLTYTNGGSISGSPATLGRSPRNLKLLAKCENAEHGFSPQDVVDLGTHMAWGTLNGVSYGHRCAELGSNNRVTARIGQSGLIVTSNEVPPVLRVLTPANWRLSIAGNIS